jgi:hypothetical protein
LSSIVERNLEVDISKSISQTIKLTPKNVTMKKGNQRLYKQEKNMASIVKQMESKDTDVLNCLASGKSFDQYEWDILFTFNIGTEEAEHLMIKRHNKGKDGIAKVNNIMEISLDIYLKKKTVCRKYNH